MNDSVPLDEILNSTLTWLQSYVFTASTLFQFAIIMTVFGLAMLIDRRYQPAVTNMVNKFDSPPRIKAILHNMRRLLMPFTALILLGFISVVMRQDSSAFAVDVIRIPINLLMAWIAIRFLVQFIENNAIRNAFAYLCWGLAALSILGIMDDASIALDAIGMNIGEFRLSALTVIKGIISLLILLYLASISSSIVDRRLERIQGLSHSSRILIGKFIRITLVIIAIIIAVTTAGIDLTLLAVFSGALGVGLGFGLQKGISNLFSGFLLLLDESIRPGDVLELPNGAFGWVDRMGARYTSIVTRDNKSFLIPNEDFVTQQIINWSHHNTLIRLETKFGVSYESDPHLVKELAEKTALEPARVVNDPAPVCHLVEFGDSSLNFVLRYWIKDAEKGVTNMRGAVMLALWDCFKENGISIPYPHRDVYIRDGSKLMEPPKPKKAPAKRKTPSGATDESD